jgi:hypothetical protein
VHFDVYPVVPEINLIFLGQQYIHRHSISLVGVGPSASSTFLKHCIQASDRQRPPAPASLVEALPPVYRSILLNQSVRRMQEKVTGMKPASAFILAADARPQTE